MICTSIQIKQKSSFYVGLDLSAAFGTLDHVLLLSTLETSLGFKDEVLSILNSYLSSKSQKKLIDGEYLIPRNIKTGVHQESVQGPVFFHAIFLLWKFCLNIFMSVIIFMPMTPLTHLFTMLQGAFDLILTSLRRWFYGAKLRSNSNKLSTCLLVERIF